MKNLHMEFKIFYTRRKLSFNPNVHELYGGTHTRQKVETAQMPLADELISKICYICAVEYCLATKRNECLTEACYNAD